MDTKIRCVWN